ncbi:hypothetical protein TERG_07249 [Paecilomyces variotii No. 5]|uniref:Cytochrome b-c1 complex subunit 6, mitochondrial n=1 Tax=Byssochlamys spectabilis (strain No. 5 / NBRC 109023) TaxID=1356009 RepID=V5FYC1_BYSSN|nr:hypothetical protein TERG_07249 [Paecilomyces variotii No. 5]
MGFSDLFADVISSLGFAEAQAEAPPAEETQNTEEESTEEKSEETEEAEEQPEEEDGGEEEEEEEEEAEEEEPEDPMPRLVQECTDSRQCASVKHHFDECVERVTRNSEDPDYNGPKEDCVEEFFHLQHCATQCAAPKLWRELK